MSVRTKIAACFILTLATSVDAVAQVEFPNQIPYQGHLDLNGVPQSGVFDFQFRLLDSADVEVWSGTFSGVQVSKGKFSVILDGGSTNLPDVVLEHEELYVRISVKASGDLTFTELSGRQRLLAVPYAMRNDTAKNYHVRGVLTVDNGSLLHGGVTVNGGATINGGASINGDVAMPGSVMLQGKQFTVAWDNGNHTVSESNWHVQAVKWQISIGSDYRARSYPIPHQILLDYCGDNDGCHLVVGMGDWLTDRAGVKATTGRRLYYDDSNGYYRIETIGSSDAVEAFDGDSVETQLVNAWNACYLLDYPYQQATLNDDAHGLFLHWSVGGFNTDNRECHLIITD